MPEQTIAVTVHLPARLWWQLAKVADQRGVKVTDVVVERASKTPGGRPRQVGAAPTRDQVIDLHAEGLTDGQIARSLNISIPTARYHRTRAGLPVNPMQR